MSTEVAPDLSAFAYNRDAPLDIREAGSEKLPRATLHDLSFANPAATRVSAYLVQPDSVSVCPAILFLHWGQGDRASFLSEALAYAEVGVESLLIDESRMSHFMVPNSMTPGGARSYLIQCVTDLRRGIDLLESRPEVDAARMGYVGHSLGASVGGQFAGVEKRVKAHVLMAGFGDTARGWNMARPNDEFLRVVAPLDGIRYVGGAPPSAILFQWASRDEVLTFEDLEIFFNASNEPKEKRWYDADHSFNHAALRDRAEWLGRQLAFTPPDESRLRRVHLPQRDLDFFDEQRPWFAALKSNKTKA